MNRDRLPGPEGCSSAEPIGVFVVDDHYLVRRGLIAFLDEVDGIKVVGTAGDGQSSLDRFEVLDQSGELPDVVLMDLVMPRMDGVEAARLMSRRFPRLRTVVLTGFAEEARVRDAVQAGVAGYVMKDCEAEDLPRAIRAAAQGRMYVDPLAAQVMAQAWQRSPGQEGLTDREWEVLEAIAQGDPNRQIARRLNLSERTVRTHVSHVLAKLGVSSRTQAALWAVQHGPGSGRPPEGT